MASFSMHLSTVSRPSLRLPSGPSARPSAVRRGLTVVPRAEASGASPQTPEFSSTPAISDTTTPEEDNEPVGAKLEKWMKSPLTFLAMGPRAGLGALSTASDVMNKLPEVQAEFEEKMNFVLNDPRPVDEKQTVIAKDMESTIAELIEAGEQVETDVLSQLSAQLPAEVLAAIPTEFKDAFPGLQATKESDPFADDWEAPAAEAPYAYSPPPSSFNKPPTAADADMVQLKDAAGSLRASLEALRDNSDPSSTAMLKVSLKERRKALARRVQEASSKDATTPSAAAAIAEASKLLEDVDSLDL